MVFHNTILYNSLVSTFSRFCKRNILLLNHAKCWSGPMKVETIQNDCLIVLSCRSVELRNPAALQFEFRTGPIYWLRCFDGSFYAGRPPLAPKQEWTDVHRFYCMASKDCMYVSKSQLLYSRHMKKHHASSTARNLIPCEKCSYVTDLIALATKHAALHLRFVNFIVMLISIYCLNMRNCRAI